MSIQKGFFNQISGEYALISLYSKITGLSEIVALQSFGLIESSILSIIIFWSAYKITKWHITPAIIATFSFIFLFNLLPFNMNLITMHSSLYLAMSLAIPIVIYSAEPNNLRAKTSSYLKWMFILHFATALTNLFVFLIVIPSALTILFFIIEKQRRPYFFRNIYAYLIALLCFLTLYFMINLVKGEDFINFIKSNILIISSYTYSPQLFTSVSKLMSFYLYLSLLTLVACLILSFYNRQSWSWALGFSSFSTLLFAIYSFHFSFIDNDLMHLLATLILPITFGCIAYIFMHLIRLTFPKLKLNNGLQIAVTLAFTLCLTSLIYLKNDLNLSLKKTALIKSETLEAYNEITTSMLPYTYTVIDHKNNLKMSTNSHFFNNYNYFNEAYLKKDSIYFKNHLKKEYLKQNPGIVLSESTLVFVYDNLSITDKNNSLVTLKALQDRGRKVELFFERPHLKVFEIINTPKSSKVSDLLF